MLFPPLSYIWGCEMKKTTQETDTGTALWIIYITLMSDHYYLFFFNFGPCTGLQAGSIDCYCDTPSSYCSWRTFLNHEAPLVSKAGFMCTLLTPTHDQSLGSGDVRCYITQLYCCCSSYFWNSLWHKYCIFTYCSICKEMIRAFSLTGYALDRCLRLNLITDPI